VFRRLTAPAAGLSFTFDGRRIAAAPGDSVAAALLAAGVRDFRRSVVGDAVRGPHCLMGVCFDCLLTIDGVPDRQSCLVPAVDGMVVESRAGRRPIGEDAP
jgi:hypothetical protein